MSFPNYSPIAQFKTLQDLSQARLNSRELAADVLTAWGIQVDRKYGGFTPAQRKYLAYHRKNVFERRRTPNRYLSYFPAQKMTS